MDELSDTELGWLAGMYEGEGSVFVRDAATQVSINSTDKDVIDQLHGVTGVGNVHFIDYTKKKPEWKDQWRWLVSRRADCRDVLYAIYPLLGERRRARIDELRPWLDAEDRRYAPWVHGTYAGATRHAKVGEPLCDACRAADNAYQREKYRQRKARNA